MENWLFPYLLPIPKVNSIWKRRWCSGIMQDSHSCDPGSIPGRRIFYFKLDDGLSNLSKIFSLTGNWTPASRVTGGDPYH